MEEISHLVHRLFDVGDRLGPDLRRELVERAAEAEAALIALVEDDSLYPAEARGGGCAPLHAMALLGDSKSVAAIPSLLRVLATSDCLDLAFSAACQALTACGAAALEPCLAAYAGSDEMDFRDGLAGVLAELKVRDERIFQILVEQLPRERTLGASHLAIYGDPRALPHLSRVLDEYRLERGDSPFANHDVVELVAAIEDLGGTLTDEQRRKQQRATAPAERFRERLRGAFVHDDAPAPPGRNEPCHCGSGRKYKKCHLRDDEDRAHA